MKTTIAMLTLILGSNSLLIAQFKPSSEMLGKPFRIEAEGRPIAIDEGYVFPTFVDLNKDGIEDLVLGGIANSGEMHYFEGTRKLPERRFKKSKLLISHKTKKTLTVPGVK